LPRGATATLGGNAAGAQDELNQLYLALLFAIPLVFIVMVVTFRSLIQPLILLVAIPFAAVGAIVLSVLTQTAIGVSTLFGFLMLIGIVVTNAIVLIDRVNHEIAVELVISEPTVRTHVTNILSKLHLADRTQAAIYALQKRLIPLEDALEQEEQP
jgi:HAE1 family hydrophobic/amphiphilic exporter-1